MSLRKVRVDARLSIDKLAGLSGISPAQIRNIEAGVTKNPRVETLTALAEALDVSPSEIDPYTVKDAA